MSERMTREQALERVRGMWNMAAADGYQHTMDVFADTMMAVQSEVESRMQARLDAAEAENAALRPYPANMECQHELVFLRGGACVLCANAAIRAKLEAAPHERFCLMGVSNYLGGNHPCDCWKANL